MRLPLCGATVIEERLAVKRIETIFTTFWSSSFPTPIALQNVPTSGLSPVEVSALVNSPKNNMPEVLEPASIVSLGR
jgi:hypothetical protein